MGRIEVKGIRVYAHHGCLEEESIIGQEFVVDVIVGADIRPSATQDELELTVDYCDITEVVKEEMSIRAKLIEVKAVNIARRVKSMPHVDTVEVRITKPKPPIAGDVREVCVIETM